MDNRELYEATIRRLLKGSSLFFAGIVLIISSTVLIGWFLESNEIVTIHPKFAPMQFNTALLIFLIAFSIFLKTFRFYLSARIVCIFVLIFASLTILQYFIKFNFGLDTLFIHNPLERIDIDAPHAIFPGRMSLQTGLCAIILSIGIILYRKSSLSIYCTTFALVISGTAFFSYTAPNITTDTLGIDPDIAVHTSFSFVLLCFASFSLTLLNKKLKDFHLVLTILLTGMALFSIFLAFLGWYTTRNHEERIIIRNLQSIASFSEETIRLRKAADEKTLVQLSWTLSTEPLDWEQIRQIFKNVAAHADLPEGIGFAENNRITLFEPEALNQDFLGFDLTTFIDKELFKEHREGRIMMSNTFSFPGTSDQKGFFMTFPVRLQEKNIEGWLVAPHKLDDFFTTGSVEDQKLFYVEIYNLDRKGNEVLFYKQAGKEPFKAMGSVEYPFEIGGHVFHCYFYPTKEMMEKIDRTQSILVLVSGFIFTSLFVFLFSFVLIVNQLMIRLIEDGQDKETALNVAFKEMEQFSYVASHDLRSPLINISGFAQRIQKSLNAIKTKDSLEKHCEDIQVSLNFVFDSYKRMDSIVTSLLRLSRAGRKEPDNQCINMNELVKDIFKYFQNAIDQNKIQIKIGNLPSIYSDKEYLENIFSNIISNSLKYLDPARQGVIEIYGEKQKHNEVVYWIKDNGRGIKSEDLDKLFLLFRRGANTQDVAGEGIGLAYVKKLLYILKGTIDLESKENEGTLVTIRIKYG